MIHLASLRQILKTFAAAALCWLGPGSYAMAVAKDAEEKSSKGGDASSWTFSYAIVMLVIGLGLLLVLKTTGRRERARPEQPSG